MSPCSINTITCYKYIFKASKQSSPECQAKRTFNDKQIKSSECDISAKSGRSFKTELCISYGPKIPQKILRNLEKLLRNLEKNAEAS